MSVQFLSSGAATGAANTWTADQTFSGGAGAITMSASEILMAKGADIASASALTLGGDGNVYHVTGTTTITSISSKQAGTLIVLVFDGALTVTHNATSLILARGTNLTTAAGTILGLISEGSGNWREIFRSTDTTTIKALMAGNMQDATIAANTVNYMAVGPASGQGSEQTFRWIVPYAGTAKNLYVQTDSAQGAGGSLVFTLRKNGANTTITITVAAGAAAAKNSDTSNTVTYAAGDYMALQVDNNDTGSASAQIGANGLEYDAS